MSDTVTRSTPNDHGTPEGFRTSREGSGQAKLVPSHAKPRAGIEGLDVYRVAVAFYRLLRQATRGRRGHAVDQSYRAAESVVLNIAEAYPMTGLDRARRFRIAGGEAAECHAGLDLMEIRGELRGAVLSELRALLDRVRAMLWRLGRG